MPGAIAAGTRQVTTVEEGRAVVRELANDGVHVIKAVVDSRGRPNSPERIPTLHAEVLGAIVNEAGRSVVLRVPSAIVGGEFNHLLNPLHPDFSKLRIEGPERFQIDRRG